MEYELSGTTSVDARLNPVEAIAQVFTAILIEVITRQLGEEPSSPDELFRIAPGGIMRLRWVIEMFDGRLEDFNLVHVAPYESTIAGLAMNMATLVQKRMPTFVEGLREQKGSPDEPQLNIPVFVMDVGPLDMQHHLTLLFTKNNHDDQGHKSKPRRVEAPA